MSLITSLRALTTTQRFAAVALACAAALALALLAQYGFAKQPCPWCILQRVIFVAVGAFALLGALLGARAARIVCAAFVLAFALLGASAAQWQNAVASKSSSCNLTLADKILNALDVEALMPMLFKVTANCADAAVRVFGVAFEHWSLALYLVLALLATSILLKLRRGI